MVNNIDIGALIFWIVPGLTSLVIVLTAWRTSPKRAAGWREAPTAPVAITSAALGTVAYLTHAAGVESSRVLDGAGIAFVATALALSAYYAVGRLSPRLWLAVVTWVVTQVPLYVFAFIVWLAVAANTQCPPDAYECPI